MPFTVDNLFDQLWPLPFKWEELGKAMSLSEDLLDEIDPNNETDEDCFRQMLEYYMANYDKQHTWEEIFSYLKTTGAKKLADKIYNLHVYPCKTVVLVTCMCMTIIYVHMCASFICYRC